MSEGHQAGAYIDSLLEPELSNQGESRNGNVGASDLRARIETTIEALAVDERRGWEELEAARQRAKEAMDERSRIGQNLSEKVASLRHSFADLDIPLSSLSRSVAAVGDRLFIRLSLAFFNRTQCVSS